jgi:hypothetical protein
MVFWYVMLASLVIGLGWWGIEKCAPFLDDDEDD